MPRGDRPSRAGPWETLGAWLRIWTPPRDAEVAPVPRAGLAIVGLGIAACVAAVLVFAVPPIDHAKRGDRRRAAQAAARAAHDAAARTRLVERPRSGGLRGATGRRRLVAALQAAITRDARARRATGELTSRVQSTRCAPRSDARVPPRPGHTAYDCLARTAVIPRSALDRTAGSIGYPYRAIADRRRGTWTFCKVDLIPGERLVPDPRTVVTVPAACLR
jgi:hypothetical protein